MNSSIRTPLILVFVCVSAINSVHAGYFTKSTLALIPPSTLGRCVGHKNGFQIYPAKAPHDDAKKGIMLPSRLFNDITTRGGAKDGDDTVEPGGGSASNLKKVVLPTILSLVAVLAAMNKKSIAAFDFKGELSSKLDELAALGTPGIIMYIIGFCLWEITVGVTTPVETAAGMAFGLKNGIWANALGKTSGALIAFLLGRYVFKGYVEEKLEDNELMNLVQDSIVKNPVRVALIWRFSFLPEQIKNFGLAVLPVKTWQFLSAVLMHGFPFTLLWTFLGAEMGLIVRGVIDQPSRTLKILMSGVYVFGFFISPSMVGLWVKGLRDEKKKKEAAAKQK